MSRKFYSIYGGNGLIYFQKKTIFFTTNLWYIWRKLFLYYTFYKS